MVSKQSSIAKAAPPRTLLTSSTAGGSKSDSKAVRFASKVGDAAEEFTPGSFTGEDESKELLRRPVRKATPWHNAAAEDEADRQIHWSIPSSREAHITDEIAGETQLARQPVRKSTPFRSFATVAKEDDTAGRSVQWSISVDSWHEDAAAAGHEDERSDRWQVGSDVKGRSRKEAAFVRRPVRKSTPWSGSLKVLEDDEKETVRQSVRKPTPWAASLKVLEDDNETDGCIGWLGSAVEASALPQEVPVAHGRAVWHTSSTRDARVSDKAVVLDEPEQEAQLDSEVQDNEVQRSLLTKSILTFHQEQMAVLSEDYFERVDVDCDADSDNANSVDVPVEASRERVSCIPACLMCCVAPDVNTSELNMAYNGP